MVSSIGRDRQNNMIAFVVATAVAVATVRPTVAAPQTDDYGGAPQLTINGQVCQCMVEFLCDSSKIVSIPSGSSGCGASNLACCRLEMDPLGSQVPAEAPQRPQTTTTQEPITTTRRTVVDQNPSRQCRCVPSKQCSVNNYDNLPDIDIRVGSCSGNQICCNNEHIVENINKKPEKEENNAGYNDDQTCGIGRPPPSNFDDPETVGTRIVNSEDQSKTYFGQFPWMVAILKTTTDVKTGSKLENVFQCGGSLIHSRVILTAAHCVSGYNTNVLKARVGEWDTQSSETDEEIDSHQDFSISKIVIHPNHHNGTMFNDVALLRLSTSITLESHIKPICIPNGKQANYDSRSCVSTGWGKNGFGGKNDRYQPVLKQVHLSIVPHSTCQQQLRQTRLGDFFILDDSFICAGGKQGQDVCKGDGGGPLICAVNSGKSNKKKYIQVGIVSWGIGCGDENIPGVYASLEANSQWIHKNLKALE